MDMVDASMCNRCSKPYEHCACKPEPPRCQECRCLLPAHYGSCSKVATIPGMSETLAQLEREKAMRTPPKPVKSEAQQVREALNLISEDSDHIGWWGALAERETDAVLLKLRRLLR